TGERRVDAFDAGRGVRAGRRRDAVRTRSAGSSIASRPMTELVLTELHDGGVALLRLNRPPMNPLSIALLDALRDAASAVAADPAVKAVVIAGSEKAFAAGADISELQGQAGARASADAFRGAFDAVASI